MPKLTMTLSPAEAQQLWDAVEGITESCARLLGFIDGLQAREEEYTSRRKLLRLVPSNEDDEDAEKPQKEVKP